MTQTQPEALRIADLLEQCCALNSFLSPFMEVVAELRRPHARIAELEDATDIAIERIAELEEQLSAIGAGGVEPLRKQASTADVADERDAFEKWLRIKPCGAAHDFGWEAWKARASLSATPAADAPVVPQGWKLVRIELLERIQESLGSFVSDQGWSQSDMDTADALNGLLARDLDEDPDPDDASFDDFAEDVEDSECHNCSGTGEGMYDGQSCVVCRGKGVCPK